MLRRVKDRFGEQAEMVPFISDAGISGGDPDGGRVTCQA